MAANKGVGMFDGLQPCGPVQQSACLRRWRVGPEKHADRSETV
jgi:hypothetical protein